jgi:hypothetical protein
MTHEQLAAAFGQDRTEITRILGLARLNQDIQDAVLSGLQTVSASALFEISACPSIVQEKLWQILVTDGASVSRLRGLKQEFEGMKEAPTPDNPAATQGQSNRGDAVARYFTGFSRRLEVLSAEVRDDPAALTDQRRAELVRVRDSINDLLGKTQ